MTSANDATDGCSVACSLPDAAQTERLAELMKELLGRVQGIAEIADGYRLRFAGDTSTRTEIDAFIAFERECCGFMTYTVVDTRDGEVALELTGPQGTKEFLGGGVLTGRRRRAAATETTAESRGCGC